MPDFLSGSNTQPRTRRVSTPPGTHPHRVQQTRSAIDGSILMIQDPPPPHRSSSKVSAPIRIAAITASRLDLTSSFRRKFVGWFCTVCGLQPHLNLHVRHVSAQCQGYAATLSHAPSAARSPRPLPNVGFQTETTQPHRRRGTHPADQSLPHPAPPPTPPPTAPCAPATEA